MTTLPSGLAGVCLFVGGEGGGGELSLLESPFRNMYLWITEASAGIGSGTCFFLVSLNVKLPLKAKIIEHFLNL